MPFQHSRSPHPHFGHDGIIDAGFDFGLPPAGEAPPAWSRLNTRIAGLDASDFRRLQGLKGNSEADSSSDDGFHPKKPAPKARPALHSRSISHPFPAIFINRKKSDAGLGDLSDDDCALARGSGASNGAMASRRLPTKPTDFASGHCMTCGGMVRWPKELNVFRCRICLTINDLKPHEPTRDDAKPLAASESLSLSCTRSILEDCLRAALADFVSKRGHSKSPDKSAIHPRKSSLSNLESMIKRQSDAATKVGHLTNDGPASPEAIARSSIVPNPLHKKAAGSRSLSTSHAGPRTPILPNQEPQRRSEVSEPKRLFKPLEDYLISCFGSFTSVNTSFATKRHGQSLSYKTQPEPSRNVPTNISHLRVRSDPPLPSLDPKLLLAGDFAENGSWWTGGQEESLATPSSSRHTGDTPSFVNSRTPRIDWGQLMEWYYLVINAAEQWTEIYDEMLLEDPFSVLADTDMQRFETSVLEAQDHLQRVLLKCAEMLLKRPGRPLKEPQDVRFLLILIVNPLLTPATRPFHGKFSHAKGGPPMDLQDRTGPGRHSGIIKRILGLLSNSSEQCHHVLIGWLSRIPEHIFLETKDLISSFVTYRLTRANEKTEEGEVDVTAGLIPEFSNLRAETNTASLHAALQAVNGSKKQKSPQETKHVPYSDDWQTKAGARVMALVFAANGQTHVRRSDTRAPKTHRHLLQISDFYNTLLDCLDFKADFETWESRRGRFAFCQYPFFLSIWAKIQILEFDAKRQMAGKAREAFFDSIMTSKTYTQYFFLRVRRDCLVDDSLKKVSEVVGSGSDDIKKGLRIEFQGEEGIDAGGLRKEWFLLLVRNLFNPDHGLFVFDEDSQYCYFNPHTFETSDQYFLVGVVLGLAIYNSTILDIALPPYAFRKLLAASPPPTNNSSAAHVRARVSPSLDDLAEYRPRLAAGLRQLLEFDGDVEGTFCLTYVIEVDKYGSRVEVPLCLDGQQKPVTNTNRWEYVDLYVRYLLDTSVNRQFEPFKRGFFTVCAGNALSLFRPEEIELLIRGSDEALDIASLKAVASYTNWVHEKAPAGSWDPTLEPTIVWFWEAFESAPIQDQRRLLSFITGSDRIPAMGAASLVIKISCLGDDVGRFPTARTCFNTLCLFKYSSRARLEEALWRAVHESEGFGLR